MIIGIIGKAGAGKDTIAKIIIKEHNDEMVNKQEAFRPFKVEKFADGLKKATSAITGIPLASFYDRERYNDYYTALGMTVRELMQKIGTGLRETVHQDIWVNTALARCPINSNFIFTDVRFPNEVEAIRKIGGMLIEVIRPDYEEKTLLTEESKNHISETALDNYEVHPHVHIINDGSLEDLKEMVRHSIVQRILTWEDNSKLEQ